MRRLTYQEALELAPLPPVTPGGHPRFMSCRAAWLPGSDIHNEIARETKYAPPGVAGKPHLAAFGGHVYAQAAKAVCDVLEAEAEAKDNLPTAIPSNLGLHTIHGLFTAMGRPDRPFVYDIAIITRGRTFLTARVDARQPQRPSSLANGGVGLEPGEIIDPDSKFSVRDALGALGVICFTALVSFTTPRPHSLGANQQETPPQIRFAPILRQRPPGSWDPAPPVDMAILTAVLNRPDLVGTFPLVDMKKVDMTAYNHNRHLHERRELIMYRLLGPLDEGSGISSVAAHALVHAYAADRNGLLMAANHLEIILNDKVATLSNSFVVHTNSGAVQMSYVPRQDSDDRLDHWWLQEVCFPRAGSGRAIVQNKIWSPKGLHVATEYQDGLCVAKDIQTEAQYSKL